MLPFAIEKQLSDDIAFVSAYEYGVRYVTAATVEASKQEGLLVRLAANEGVCAMVRDAWKRLFSILERCAEKALSLSQCAEDAFNVVVNLNRNKILGRLASRHFRRPPHENGPARIALSERFKAYIGSSKRQSTETKELHRQADVLHAAFLSVEDSEADTGTIKHVVKEAFRLTIDGFSLPVRLERARFPPSNMDTREIREINKIANYWRICHSLAHLSRSYRTLFAKIKLESIKPFAPSVRHGSSKTRHVHAEVQMLVYYEIRGPPIWPRVIGASKEACFLCNSFIKAHGFFYVSKAHRQIYSQWTIPDLADYSAEALDRLQRVLVAVSQDVASALKQARYNRSFRPFPLQSSINLHKPSFPTPSVTTIRSSCLEGTDIASEKTVQCLPSAPEGELLEFDQLSLSRKSSSSKNSSNSVSKEEAPDSNEDLLRSLCWGIQTRRLEPTYPEHTFSDWLDLYAYLERSPDSHFPTKAFSAASVTQESIPNSIAMGEWNGHRLDLSSLAPGEEIVLSNPMDRNQDVSVGAEISVILTYQRMNPIVLKCSWHGTTEVRV